MNSLSCTIRKSVMGIPITKNFMETYRDEVFFFAFLLACSGDDHGSQPVSFIIWIFCLVHYKNQSILHDTISGHPYIPERSDCSDLVPKTADKVNRAATNLSASYKEAIRSLTTTIFAARQAYVTITQLSYLMFHIHSIPLTTGQCWIHGNTEKA
jgi:hypothetical protein